jgi:Ca2+-dependent lipid-binding protein
LSWTVAIFGGGIGWLFIVMAFCATYYRTSIRRVRRNFRDDIRREMAKTRLESDTETLEWINSFLVKFWPIYAPVLSKTVVMSVDQVLSVATPPMVESLKLTTFNLGTKPPRLEHVKTYPKSEDDIVLMDWKFSFNPNDTADMTARQLKVKQNPKIVLEVRLGKGVVSKGLDVIVEDMACEGVIQVKVKLQTAFPHVERIEICFLEKPTFDYVCKPLGGDTFGFDINFIPGLEHFIVEQIHASLQPMMYAPNVFPIEIAKMLAGTPVDQAIGVVQVTFQSAQGLKNPDQFAGTPDPYALIKVNDRTEIGRTKTLKETSNPAWNETFNILVTSLKDTLNVHVFDFNEFRKDRELGLTTFPLERLERQTDYENEQLELTWNGKARGLVQADIRYFPVLGPTKLEDGTMEPPPETRTGIIRFEVEQAKELDGTKSLIGILNPYVVLLLNGKEVHVSEKKKRTNFPVWESAHKELLITDRKTAKLGLVIKDDRDLTADPVVGSYQIRLEDMLDLSAKGQEWYNLSGVKTGRAKMKVQWRPVDLKGSVLGSDGYLKPIGVMRIYFQNARDLRNVETVGKSDPYARILLSGVQRARTVTWQNNLNPDFDEVLYVPVHAVREKLTIEVMDEESMANDRSLGHFEIPLKDYITEEDGEYLVHDTKEMLSRTLGSGPSRAQKGNVNFTCSFFPCIPTVDPDEEEREKEIEALAKKSTDIPRPSTDSAKAVEAPKMAKEASSQGQASATASPAKVVEPAAQAVQPPPQKPKLKVTADNLVEYGMLTGLDIDQYSRKLVMMGTIFTGPIISNLALPLLWHTDLLQNLDCSSSQLLMVTMSDQTATSKC